MHIAFHCRPCGESDGVTSIQRNIQERRNTALDNTNDARIDDAGKDDPRKDDATNDDEAVQGIDVSMGDGAGAMGSGLSALERAEGLGGARAGGGELPDSKRTRTIGASIV